MKIENVDNSSSKLKTTLDWKLDEQEVKMSD